MIEEPRLEAEVSSADRIRLRKHLFQHMEGHGRGWRDRWLDWAVMALIATNVVAVVLESDVRLWDRHATLFFWFEMLSVAAFTLEYLVRLWFVPEHKLEDGSRRYRSRWVYMRSPMALVDVAAILPFYLSLFMSIDLRVLRVLRLVRIFKLTRYSRAMSLLLTVLRNQAASFVSATALLMMVVLLAASGMYLAEHRAQPEVFGSIPQALWWATVTMTTVGYGDVVPVTLMGRWLGGLIMVCGVTMVALPAGILASGYSSEIARRRERYLAQARSSLLDGELTWHEKRLLGVLRNRLGLAREEAKMLIAEAHMTTRDRSVISCPHCEEPIYLLHPVGKVDAAKKPHPEDAA